MLSDRLTPTVVAAFDPNSHLLQLVGDETVDTVLIARTAEGDITVNGIATGANLTNCDTITVHTAGGDDSVTVDQTKGFFANGFSAEASGLGEIEFQIDLGGGEKDSFTIWGTN